MKISNLKSTFIFILFIQSTVFYSQTLPIIGFSDAANYIIGNYDVPGSSGLDLHWYGGIRFGDRSGNSVMQITNGNVGIGTSTPSATLDLKKLNSNLVFDLNTNGISRIISKGWNANIDIHTFQISGVENFNQLHLNTNGNVGIGNSEPDAPLTVYGSSNFYPIRHTYGGDVRQFSIRHSFINPQFLNNLYPIILGTGGGNQPIILDAARVGIGTANPSSMLTVAGNIASREVKVTVDAGADFVFEKDYDLPSLDCVDKYIKENKHLPEIASAEEMKKDGINLSEMNIKLLQKMEEMTLYMIEQEKKNIKQSQEIELLNKKLSKIEESINSKSN